MTEEGDSGSRVTTLPGRKVGGGEGGEREGELKARQLARRGHQPRRAAPAHLHATVDAHTWAADTYAVAVTQPRIAGAGRIQEGGRNNVDVTRRLKTPTPVGCPTGSPMLRDAPPRRLRRVTFMIAADGHAPPTRARTFGVCYSVGQSATTVPDEC